MKKEIIVTLGPALIEKPALHEIINAEEQQIILRINTAHVNLDSLEAMILQLRQEFSNKLKFILDMCGTKIRTANILKPIVLKQGDSFTIQSNQLSHPEFMSDCSTGATVITNDSQLELEIIDASEKSIHLKAKCNGIFENNKGFHIVGLKNQNKMPLFQEKDFHFIDFAVKNNIHYIGVSYLRSAEEISYVNNLLEGSQTSPIFKIETKEALEDLDNILPQIQKAILDRGDLAAELGIYNLLQAQEQIIEGCKNHNVDLYVATQLLFNLVEHAAPLIPEILELSRLIREDIHGLQFSDECAIGMDPAKCIRILRDLEETVQKNEMNMLATSRF